MSRKTSKASALGSKLDQQSRDFESRTIQSHHPAANPATREEYEAVMREASQSVCLITSCSSPYEHIVFYDGQFPRNKHGVLRGVCASHGTHRLASMLDREWHGAKLIHINTPYDEFVAQLVLES
jgi:hypothetical protein